jgi:hypothetical protein
MRYHEGEARSLSRRGTIGHVTGKRRLPVVQLPDGRDSTDESDRPAWQWVCFGAGAIFVAWLPLSAIAFALASRVAQTADPEDRARLLRDGIAIGMTYASAIALGALGGGFIVGRWAGGGVGTRHAALSGLAAAGVAMALSCASFGFAPRSLLVAVVTVPAATLGGVLGRRGRSR